MQIQRVDEAAAQAAAAKEQPAAGEAEQQQRQQRTAPARTPAASAQPMQQPPRQQPEEAPAAYDERRLAMAMSVVARSYVDKLPPAQRRRRWAELPDKRVEMVLPEGSQAASMGPHQLGEWLLAAAQLDCKPAMARALGPYLRLGVEPEPMAY